MDWHTPQKNTLNLMPYYGGKYRQLMKIEAHYPNPVSVTTFVDVFGGGGVVTLNYPYREKHLCVYNDINSSVVNLYRVIRDKDKAATLADLLEFTPVSRQEKAYAWENYCNDSFSDVEKAHMYIIVISQSFFAREVASWCVTKGMGVDSRSPCIETIRKYPGKIPKIHAVFLHTQIECLSYERIFKIYDSPTTFFYCDPPYVETKKGRGVANQYVHGFSEADHERFLQDVSKLKGKVLISGMENPIYSQYLHTWNVSNLIVKKNASNCGINQKAEFEPRVETLWYNYELNKDKTLF